MCVCVCVEYHSVVCGELNVELDGTSNLPLCSKDENQYSSENNPQLSAIERLGHPCTVFFQPAQLHKYQVKSLCFVCFSFFFFSKKNQHNLCFSDMEHFFVIEFCLAVSSMQFLF